MTVVLRCEATTDDVAGCIAGSVAVVRGRRSGNAASGDVDAVRH